jgi:hypothetical protein
MTAGPEWDGEDSNRHQDQHEQGSEALGYALAGNLEDARRSVAVLDDPDLEALRMALDDLEAECAEELGRRHS